jgi:O-antigen ligase
MIQPELAILLWVPISAALMMDRNAARGLTIAMIGALLLLPSGVAADMLGAPQLTKTGAAGIGILLGTAIFHSRLMFQFRPRWFDAFMVAMLGSMVFTSWNNGLGIYDGVSTAIYETLDVLTLWLAARIVLYRPEALKTFLLGIAIAGAIYTPFVVWEWRLSPQIHYTVYGEFQHQFAQFHRWGFFRPVVCFPHALDLGRFMALAAFLAALPLRKDLGRIIPGGQVLFAAPLLSLALSMSIGPYILFSALCVGFTVLRVPQMRSAMYAVPACAVALVAILASGGNPYARVFETAQTISADRADSFQYRIDALEEYQAVIAERPWFGHGGWSRGRLSHRATDSDLLIRMLKFGAVGAGFYYAWWGLAFASIASLARKTRGAPFERIVRALTVALAIGLAISTIDRALDPQIVVAVSSIVGIERLVRSGRLTGTHNQHAVSADSTPTQSRTATA